MPGSVDTLNVAIKADVSGLKSGIKEAESGLDGFEDEVESVQNELKGLEAISKQVKQAVAGMFIANKVIEFGKQCVDIASDLQEVQNVVDVTFGSAAGEIDEWAKTTKDGFGMSELAAKQYASTMGAMLKSSGLSGSAVKDMSVSMAELTADMASFYNLDLDTAFEKIRSGISGETDPLQQLGINMSVANMEAYALSQGITKSYSAMSQAEQTQLRYNYLMEQTADAQGDFARTSSSWANQVKLLQENIKSLMADIGSGLIAVLTPVINVVNEVIEFVGELIAKIREWAENLINTIKQNQVFMSALATLGNELSELWELIKQFIGMDIDGELNLIADTVKVLITLLTPLIELLNAVLSAVNDILKALASAYAWVRSLFGMGEGTDATVTATAESMGDMADNASDTADGLNDADKVAKKLNNTIGGLDELHILSQDDDPDNLRGTVGAIKDAQDAVSSVKKDADDFPDGLVDAIKDVDNGLGDVVKTGGKIPPMLDGIAYSAKEATRETNGLRYELNALNDKIVNVDVNVHQPQPIIIPQPSIPEIPPIKVPIEQPDPVKIPIEQPQPVEIPIEQPQPIKVPIEEPQPVKIPIEQPQPVRIPVEQPQPSKVPIEQPEPVKIPIEPLQPVEIPIEQPQPVKIPIEQLKPVEIPIAEPEPVPIAADTSELDDAKAKVNELYQELSKKIEVDLQADDAVGDLDRAKEVLKNLQASADKAVKIAIETDNIDAVKEAETQIKSLSSSEHDIRVELNPNAVQSAIDGIGSKINELTGGHAHEIVVALAGAAAVASALMGIQADVSALANTEATATVSADVSGAQTALNGVSQETQALISSHPTLMLEANTNSASSAINDVAQDAQYIVSLNPEIFFRANMENVSSAVAQTEQAAQDFSAMSFFAALGLNNDGIDQIISDTTSKLNEFGAIEEKAKIQVDAKDAEKEVNSLQKAIQKINFGAIGETASSVFSKISSLIEKVTEKLKSFADSLKSTGDSAGSSAGGSSAGSPASLASFEPVTSIPVATYAGGGFPDKGQLFVARENGPEAVGTIGGQTAVANNQQITDAIATAVSGAMSSVMENYQGSGVLEARISGDDLALTVKRANRKRGANISSNFGFGGR